jgi:hypothetical protein
MPERPRPASPGVAYFVPSEPEVIVKTALRPACLRALSGPPARCGRRPVARLPLIEPKLAEEMFAREPFYGKIGLERLTAMGAHLKVLADFTPRATRAPTLFVRARDPLPIDGVGPDHRIWRHTIEFADAMVEVPGNHMSIMEDDNARAVAQAVHMWLSAGATR